jgi:adenylate cyclase
MAGGEASLQAAFAEEARRGARLAALARIVMFAALLSDFVQDATFNLHNPLLRYRAAWIAAAAVGGLLNAWLAGRSPRPLPWSFAFAAFDAVAFTAIVFGWLPPFIADYPQYLSVRYQDVLILALIVTIGVLPLSRGLTLAGGLAAAAIWAAAVLHSFLTSPGARLASDVVKPGASWPEALAQASHPQVMIGEYLVLQVLLILGLATALFLAARQGRDLVTARVQAAGEGARLSRYFPPAVAARILESGRIAEARRSVAILFAAPPTGDIAALSHWYAGFERQVFAAGGVVDRFTGEAAMASFGALEAAADPVRQGLDCVRALRRADSGIRLALNAGEAVCGEVGDAAQPAFGVVGDVVNTARRILDTVPAGGGATLSDSVAEAVADRSHFKPLGEQTLPGRRDPVILWGLDP